MSLRDTMNDCKAACRQLGRYEDYPINDLANEYAEALETKNLAKQNIYFAALILRFWNKIGQIYEKCKGYGVTREDAFNILVDQITAACTEKAWQNPNTHTNAQACINQKIQTRGIAAVRYEAGLQKNQANVFNASLDASIKVGKDNTDEVELGDTIKDSSTDYNMNSILVKHLIQQSFIKTNKIVAGIIADTIANTDSCKRFKKIVKTVDSEGNKKKYTEYSSQFSRSNVVKELNSLPEGFADYFCNKYKIAPEKFSVAEEAIRKAPNSKLYKYVDKTVLDLKKMLAD